MASGFLFVFWLTILGCVLGLPFDSEGEVSSKDYCIKLTPEKKDEIKTIVSKISKFLDYLAVDHEEFDISLVSVDIDRHRADDDHKDVKIQLTVNDCDDSTETVKDTGTMDSGEKDSNRNDSGKADSNENESGKADSSEREKGVTNSANDDVSNNSALKVKPSLYELSLAENEEELIREVEKRRQKKSPLIVYVQEREGREEFVFLK
ncbi:uncharacterized protein LOC126379603 [Pectinophora gossypiella]|uniref:uncharacterized protein LOC126379603 n=1 Tax=Pectinophora gossypiella TaxID=13191 RepID=UPI00214E17D4|nr:uncharacterized protein LOC126379603 [Pectinophora gossypiella]